VSCAEATGLNWVAKSLAIFAAFFCQFHLARIVASGLSQSGNTPLDRKTLTDHMSSLQAQQEMLVEQSTFNKTE